MCPHFGFFNLVKILKILFQKYTFHETYLVRFVTSSNLTQIILQISGSGHRPPFRDQGPSDLAKILTI